MNQLTFTVSSFRKEEVQELENCTLSPCPSAAQNVIPASSLAPISDFPNDQCNAAVSTRTDGVFSQYARQDNFHLSAQFFPSLGSRFSHSAVVVRSLSYVLQKQCCRQLCPGLFPETKWYPVRPFAGWRSTTTTTYNWKEVGRRYCRVIGGCGCNQKCEGGRKEGRKAAKSALSRVNQFDTGGGGISGRSNERTNWEGRNCQFLGYIGSRRGA